MPNTYSPENYSTRNQQMNSFLVWASQRIEKEIAENEKMERLEGRSDYLKPERPMKGRKVTFEEKVSIIESIDELKSYMTKGAACEKMGIHPCTYPKWKRLVEASK
jgi:DNA invertase Pin-like site-specific DNA recombinase